MLAREANGAGCQTDLGADFAGDPRSNKFPLIWRNTHIEFLSAVLA